MDPQLKDKLNENVHNGLKMLSNWAFATIGVIGAWWMGLTPEAQAAHLAASPLPAWSYPLVMSAIGVVLRLWPQKSLMPPAEPEGEDAVPPNQ